MEELKLLAEMVAGLPAMALWVIAFFFGYKVIVVGSIYGVIRYVVKEICVWLKMKKGEEKIIYKEGRGIKEIMISGNYQDLISQLRRCMRLTGDYIHDTDIDWLAEAIDMKIQSEKKEG